MLINAASSPRAVPTRRCQLPFVHKQSGIRVHLERMWTLTDHTAHFAAGAQLDDIT